MTETVESRSAADTFAYGKALGEKAAPGEIYTLVGDLGVGKTVFTAGVCGRAWHHGTGEQPYLYDSAEL